MDFKLQTSILLKELNSIDSNSFEVINQATKSIIICRNLLTTFKKEIIKNDFKSRNEEIIFFKEVKLIPLIQLIYFSEIRSFEIQLPKADKQSQKKHIQKKLNKLNRFFLYNMDFGQYIESNQTHFDLQYFTRDYLDRLPITSSKFYFQDPEFCTPRDMLLGKYKAYKLFIQYLQNKLEKLRVHKNKANTKDSGLKWTANKTALTELVYALHSNRVINNGNTDLKEIAESIQKVFHCNLGNFYKTYSEIKARKMSRTKFLDDLSSGLLTHMNNSDE
ncbi:RteC domain-containing protein [Joostella atrarenae]|uniref:RteC domain-containing protein n=1 Tax=Joostella atrarenae TaxID=679257 RepID=A0ABS9J2M4_9FLAO|nr:RteC domain-containing protein [Joostella atrarenae]MCF8714663.1 RteC domain-containing protein [Joostella atrarenae]